MSAVPPDLPPRADQTTAEAAWPVRLLSQKITEYINRMSVLWVEGEIIQFNRRPGAAMAFLTLRDLETDASLPLVIYTRVLDGLPIDVEEGRRVVVRAKPTFWSKRGSFQLQVDDIRAVGLGDVLAKIEELRRKLQAEGLFDADRKKALPFIPRRVGLICGRESKAEHDVVVNASARWPAVDFEIREVAVQGTYAVKEVSAAIAELDAIEDIDVIVVARGGGSVEDLLPFSSESLLRVVAETQTPLVSAIGHETDCPLLDLVADYRASTPTDAARRIVPDLDEEIAGLRGARERMATRIEQRLSREESNFAALRSRPVLADPFWLVDSRQGDITALRDRLRSRTSTSLLQADAGLQRLQGQLHALSPAATLTRGYAVVQLEDGSVLRDPAEVTAGDTLRIRVTGGRLEATAT